jgi:hypothetical protein
VKDSNCIDKDYEEANEWGVAASKWGCTFCWSGRTIHMMDREGLAIMHMAEWHEVGINIERRELKIQIDIGIHSKV